MSSSDAHSDSLPSATQPSSLQPSLSREGSLYLKRGASIQALQVQDPTKASAEVQPADATAANAASNTQQTVPQPSSEAEGGQLSDAYSDLKQWTQ